MFGKTPYTHRYVKPPMTRHAPRVYYTLERPTMRVAPDPFDIQILTKYIGVVVFIIIAVAIYVGSM